MDNELPYLAKDVPKLSSDTSCIYVMVKFSGKGKVFLDYLDSNYRGATVRFINSSEADTIIYRKVFADGPTIFKYNRPHNGNLYATALLGLNINDTIALEYSHNEVAISKSDKKNLQVSSIFGVVSLAENQKERSIHSIPATKQALEGIKKSRELKIRNIPATTKADSLLVDISLQYNRLIYYDNLFRLSYPAKLSEEDRQALLPVDNDISDIKKDMDFLGEIKAGESKSFLYYISHYYAALHDKNFGSPLDKIQYLDAAFCKKRYLDGYVFDQINQYLKTVTEQKEWLERLKPFLSSVPQDVFVRQKLSSSALLAGLTTPDNRNISFSNALDSTQSLILLDFWASWCVPCIAQIPRLKYYSGKYEKEVKVISISIDENNDKWKQAAMKYKVINNSYRIANGRSSALIKYFEISSIPRYVLMNNRGEIYSTEFYRPSDADFEINLIKTIHADKEAQ